MSPKKNKPENTPTQPKSWRYLIPHMVAGVVFVTAATFFAQKVDVAPKLQLDFQGLRADGRATPLPEGGYRLSYTHPTGTIFARSWRGNLGLQRLDRSNAISVAYSTTQPEQFQPATVSYIPVLSVVVLTVAGMSCILYANRRIRQMRVEARRERLKPDKG